MLVFLFLFLLFDSLTDQVLQHPFLLFHFNHIRLLPYFFLDIIIPSFFINITTATSLWMYPPPPVTSFLIVPTPIQGVITPIYCLHHPH